MSSTHFLIYTALNFHNIHKISVGYRRRSKPKLSVVFHKQTEWRKWRRSFALDIYVRKLLDPNGCRITPSELFHGVQSYKSHTAHQWLKSYEDGWTEIWNDLRGSIIVPHNIRIFGDPRRLTHQFGKEAKCWRNGAASSIHHASPPIIHMILLSAIAELRLLDKCTG